MVRSLGELGENPPRNKKRVYPKAPPRECYLCGEPLGRGMSVEDRYGFKHRRPCSWRPAVESDPDVLP